MYKGTLSRRVEYLIHFAYWLLVCYFTFVKNPLQVKWFGLDLFSTTYLVVFVLTFYFHYFIVMKQVFKSFHWKKFFAGALVSYLFFTATRWLTEQVITDIVFNKINYVNPTFGSYMLDNVHYSTMPIILSSFLWFVIYFIRLQEYNRIILEENKNTEIKFLKAQINPHFVFNTLNNIYSMVYFKSDKALIAIEKLSHVMQFTSYESQKEKIRLSDEMNYIAAYIELEQLRHQDDAFVRLKVELENDRVEVPPYILSPLVENALKHGVASNDTPIEVELKVHNGQLVFRVANTIAIQKKDKLGGIGLDNLKKRLEIHYPHKHKLQLTHQENKFIAELQIDLA